MNMKTNKNKNYEVFTAACNYIAAGLEVIYNHPEKKAPLIEGWQIREFTIEELEEKILRQGWHVGIRNIEGLDFDNNGFPGADEMLHDWKELVSKEHPGLIEKLLIEKTRSGGFHVVYKCNVIEGNQKLAERPLTEEEKAEKPQQKTVVLIETRGKGGQFVVSPSLGYTLIQGDWCNLPEITPNERLTLLECAKVFNRVPKIQTTPTESYTGEKRPGDIYNDSEEGKIEALQLLIEAGWSKVYERKNVVYLCRPGKIKGVSASFGYIDPGIFYNFSASGAPFEPKKTYSPFAVFTFLKYGGNFSQAAKELAKLPDIAKNLPKKNESKVEKNHFTDLGNANKFAEYFGGIVRFDHKKKRWLIWQEPRWRPDVDGKIYRLAIASVKRQYKEAEKIQDDDKRKAVIQWTIKCENKTKLEAACEIAKNLDPITDSGEKWDQNTMLLSCPNGIVNLTTSTLRPGKAEDLITMTTGINYNPHAVCPLWKQFLNETFDGNQELINYIHKAIGYSLTGRMDEQVVFFCYGVGANGKSVFISVLQKIFGDYGHNVPFSTFQNQGARGNTNDLAALELKRWVVSSEALGGKRLDETVVKNISGGDPVTARYLFKEFGTFIPHCKIWFFVNHKPVVKDDSHGFWRRVRLIPFTHTVEKAKQNKKLASKLQTEAEGILAWLIEGALLWQKEGLTPIPKAVEDATAEYQRDSDTLADFIYEKCVVNNDAQVQANELWIAYKLWEDGQGLPEKEKLGSKGFYGRIGEKYKKVATKKGKIYKGIYLGSSSGDGSQSDSKASDGSAPQNAKESIFTPHMGTSVKKESEASPVTRDVNESDESVENFEIPEDENV